MPSFKGTTRQTIDAKYTSATDLTTPTESPGIEQTQAWTSGTGNNQANRLFADSHELVATSINLDLYGGLVDAFGNTLNLAKVKELWLRNTSIVATEQLLISGNFLTGALLSGWVDDAVKLILGPGGQLRWTNPIDGYTVTQTTQDILTIDSGSDTITYEIVILGTQ